MRRVLGAIIMAGLILLSFVSCLSQARCYKEHSAIVGAIVCSSGDWYGGSYNNRQTNRSRTTRSGHSTHSSHR